MDDQGAVRALIQSGMQQRWGSAYDPAATPDTDDVWSTYVSNGDEVLVAEIGNEIVGRGMLTTDSGFGRLRRTAVKSECRRQGVGRRIIVEDRMPRSRAHCTTHHMTPAREWAVP